MGLETAAMILAGGSQAAEGGANLYADIQRNRAERDARHDTLVMTTKLARQGYYAELRETNARFSQEQEAAALDISRMHAESVEASGRFLAAAGSSSLAGTSVAEGFARYAQNELVGVGAATRQVTFVKMNLNAQREAARRRALESIWGAAGDYVKPVDWFGALGKITKGASGIAGAV